MSSQGAARTDNDLAHLAPEMQVRVRAFIAECNNAENNLNAIVFETYRSKETAAMYYKRGRPPSKEYPGPVTNAKDSSFTWHGYGLAIDVIHKTKQWGAGDEWFHKVAVIAKKHGLKWGGDWKKPDLPHFQFDGCMPSPSIRARELYAKGQIEEVQRIVGARKAA